jgi:SAM-dependent methyltransferase
VRLLDVACRDGNVAIPAARARASVTALDLTPELPEAGRARAARAGAVVDCVLGDAKEHPFADGSFDAITSNFGAIFAPRHGTRADGSRCAPRSPPSTSARPSRSQAESRSTWSTS